MKNGICKCCAAFVTLIIFILCIYTPDFLLDKERKSVYNKIMGISADDIQVFEVQYNSIKNILLDATYIAAALESGDEKWDEGMKLVDKDMKEKWIGNLDEILFPLTEDTDKNLYDADFFSYYSERKKTYIAKLSIPKAAKGIMSIVFEPDTGIPIMLEAVYDKGDLNRKYSEIKAMYEKAMGIKFLNYSYMYDDSEKGGNEQALSGSCGGDGLYSSKKGEDMYKDYEATDVLAYGLDGTLKIVSSDGVFELKVNMFNNDDGSYYFRINLSENFD